MIDTKGDNRNLDIKCRYKGGGNLLMLPPVFSNDGKTVFIAWKCIVASYNTKTGKRMIEFKGLTSDIVGFDVFNLSGIEHLVACSKKGKVIIWKSDNALKICKKKTVRKVSNFKVIHSHYSESFPKCITTIENEHNLVFGLFDLNTSNWCNICTIKRKHQFQFDVGGENNIMAITQNRTLLIVNLEDYKQIKKVSINKGRNFTAVACHSSEQSVITGDSTGRVLLWQGLFSPKPTQAVYHWHTLPVNTLRFSTSGSMFYSGGGECVIVKWNIEDSNQKKFLPRLPSNIRHISVANNNLYLAISTEDNGIQIIDSRFQFVSVVQHLVLAKKFPAGIRYDERTKALVLNGIIGHVQFYSPQDMNLLYNLDITCQNKLTDEREKSLVNTEVIRLDISKHSSWMASVEERNEVGLSYEQRLKFWFFNATKQIFELKTSIENPHEKTVLDVKFRPSKSEKDLSCVTLSEDNKFKIWQCDSEGKSVFWRCSAAGYYRNYPAKSVSFSSDGSVLAVAFGPTLTLWLPDTLELKSSLLHPLHTEDIKQIAFGTRNDCHLIASISANRLTVWNILNLSIAWSVSLDCQLLVADLWTTNMAIFTRKKKLHVFTLNSSEPVYVSNETLLKTQGDVIAATFIPSVYCNDTSLGWHQRSQLCFIDTYQELYSLDTNEEFVQPSQLLQEDFGTSLYKSSLSRIRTTNKKKEVSYVHLYCKKDKIIEDLMYAPNTTKMPIQLSCEQVLLSMVHQKE